MSTLVHIHAPKGHYIGQVKRLWAKRWRTVTLNLLDAKTAMAIAVLRMDKEDSRARVLFVDTDGWYEPHVVMECKR
jgi:hypothetical protein